MKSYLTLGLAAVLTMPVFSPPAFAGHDDWRTGRGNNSFRSGNRDNRDNRDGRDWRHHRGRRDRDRDRDDGAVIIADDNINYNNANYLGYPPWYRLNYYTPWMSDYRNGTAWTNIPNSHAAEGYGMPPYYNTIPSGYYKWLATNAAANSYAPLPAAPTVPAAPYAAYAPPEPVFPGADYANAGPSMSLAGNDIVVVVQRELRRRGLYQGIINGVSDTATRKAIRAYEGNTGLPATGGIIGVDLLRSLGLLQ